MKEITRIHLASIPFNVEIEAKKALEKYLNGVETSLVADKDTMREIEARVAEILNERGVIGEKVITSDDLAIVIEQLGEPAAFIDEEALDSDRSAVRPIRKLYRDSDGAMLAGVFGGIAAYFRIDATIVRLIGVVLLFVTAGAMIPVYVVLAIVVPAAKTAAQKLQMAGEPVTLESLKEQTSLSSYNKNQRIMIRILTIITGIGFSIAAVASLTGLAVATAMQFDYVFRQDWQTIALAFGIGTAGILFVTLMTLLAYASFAMKFTKKIGYSLLIIMVAGILLAAVSGGGARWILGYPSDDNYYGTISERKLDADALVGIGKIIIDSEYPVSVNYVVQEETPLSASYSHSSLSEYGDGEIKLTNDNGTLRVTALASTLRPCGLFSGDICQQRTVSIVGPALESIALSAGNNMNYVVTGGQKSLVVTQSGLMSDFVVESNRPIVNLEASVGEGSTFDGSEANIVDAKITVRDNESSVDLARLKSVEFTVPESCAEGDDTAKLEVLAANTVTVNGAPYSSNAEYPCVSIDFNDRARYNYKG